MEFMLGTRIPSTLTIRSVGSQLDRPQQSDAHVPGDALAVDLAALEPALELGDGVHAGDADPVHADDSVPDLDRARVRLVHIRNRAALPDRRDEVGADVDARPEGLAGLNANHHGETPGRALELQALPEHPVSVRGLPGDREVQVR